MERIATEYRMLRARLDDGELVGKAQELAAVLTDEGLMEQRHEEFRARMKAERQELEAKVGRLVEVVRTRTADKDVEIEIRGDFARGIAEEVRTDTGEVIATRSLRSEEYQSLLPGTGGPPSAEGERPFGAPPEEERP